MILEKDNQYMEKIINLINLCKKTGDYHTLLRVGISQIKSLLIQVNSRSPVLLQQRPEIINDLSSLMKSLNAKYGIKLNFQLFNDNWIEIIEKSELLLFFQEEDSNQARISLDHVKNLFECYYELKRRIKPLLTFKNGLLNGKEDFTKDGILNAKMLHYQEHLLSSLKVDFNSGTLAKLIELQSLQEKLKNRNKIYSLEGKIKIKDHSCYLKMIKEAGNYYFISLAIILLLLGSMVMYEAFIFPQRPFSLYSPLLLFFFGFGGCFLCIFLSMKYILNKFNQS